MRRFRGTFEGSGFEEENEMYQYRRDNSARGKKMNPRWDKAYILHKKISLSIKISF